MTILYLVWICIIFTGLFAYNSIAIPAHAERGVDEKIIQTNGTGTVGFGPRVVQAGQDEPLVISGCTIQYQAYLLLSSGGGYIDWTIWGEAARLVRTNIDNSSYYTMGTNDGVLQHDKEIAQFIEYIEDEIEERIIRYHYIRITRANIESYSGLWSNQSIDDMEEIRIHLKFSAEADLSGNVPLASQKLYDILFSNNETRVDQKEDITIITAGFGSYSDPKINDGTLWHFRHPAGEIVLYSGPYRNSDTISYEQLSPLESPVILFIIVLITMILTLIIPRWHFKHQMERVVWLHRVAKIFAIVIVLIFILGTPGIAVYISLPVILGATILLCRKYYKTKSPVTETKKKTAFEPDLDPKRYYLPPQPGNAERMYDNAISAYCDGEYQPALELINQALSLQPFSIKIINDKGVILRNMGRIEEALECYEEALVIKPDFIDAWRNKGFALYQLRNYEDAKVCYERVLELNPKDVEADEMIRRIFKILQ